MPRRVLPLFAAALILGCARSRDEYTADGRLVLHYWEKWTGFEGAAMQAVVDDFNASQDRLFVAKLTVSQVDRKLMLATAGGNPPDLAGLWSHSIVDFARKGALTPLDRMLREAGISREAYIPVYWDLCAHEGFVWGMPTTPATVALHWNKALFREAGLDPDRPPRTLGELQRMADRLTLVEIRRGAATECVRYTDLTAAEQRGRRFTVVQLGHIPWQPGWWMPNWCYWFGGSLWDGERHVTADSPQVIESFRWFARHAEKYGVDNLRAFRAGFGNFSSPQNAFLAGKVAMVLQGVWMYNFIDKYAPHLEWAAAPFPSVDAEGLPMVTIAECDVIVIPRGAPHPREAFAFIRYLQSQPAMEKLNLGQRKFSPLANVSAGFLDEHPNPEIGIFMELARSPNARCVPRMPNWFEYRDELQAAIDQVIDLLATPRAALTVAQRRGDRALGRALSTWDLVGEKRTAEWSAYDPW